ncbi:MAG TPA: inositol monophosphatase family protein [Puia sp.]|nr:inositol monophosphatase family protein [Puia sp.]
MLIKPTLIKAAEAAGKVLQQYYGKQFQISNKEGVNNLVTEADHAAEKLIMEIIRAEYPDHYILSEESGDMPAASKYKWIIDPLDGTVNFAHGLPLCCVSIGVEYDGEMLMGAVYNPFINEFYFAQKGYGATLNDRQLRVSDETEVIKACLVTGFPYTYLDQPNGPLEVFGRLIRRGVPVRRLGSAAMDLCWVAAGRFDGFFEHKLNAWDSAAGFLIVEEAGGRVSDFSGAHYSPYQSQIVATNGKIHAELLEWVAGTKA